MEIDDKGGRRLRRKGADPAYAERITEIREGMRDMDRSYAMHLARIQKVAQTHRDVLDDR